MAYLVLRRRRPRRIVQLWFLSSLAVCPESIKPVLWYSEVPESPQEVHSEPIVHAVPKQEEPVVQTASQHIDPVIDIPQQEVAPVAAVEQQTSAEAESS